MRFSSSFLLFLSLALAGAFTLVGCSRANEEDPEEAFDRGALLRHWADQTILPGYSAWAGITQQLAETTALFVAEPTVEKMESVRASFKSSYSTWQSVASFDFGPAADRALLSTTNTFPTDTLGIMEDVLSVTWTPGTPTSLDRIGLPALDYLLFANGDGEEGVLWFTEDPNRGQHLLRIVEFLAEESLAVSEAWTGGYRDNYVASTGTELGSGLGATLNAFNRTFEGNLRKQKLGLPSGVSTFSQTPLPTHVEAPFAGDLSLDLMKSSFQAYRNFYMGVPLQGDGTLGLDDYLRSLGDVNRGEQLDTDIQAQIDGAEEALATLESPLSEFVMTHQDQTFAAYAELQGLVVLWKVDMMSALGVLVTYQDNDGD